MAERIVILMPGRGNGPPRSTNVTLLQVALDTLSLDDAVQMASLVAPDVDLVEAGTPLIKRYGIEAVRRLRQSIPDGMLVADMKTVDAGKFEADLAFDAGADILTVLSCASDSTITAMVTAANASGRKIIVDLLGASDLVGRARQLAELGVHFLGIHAGSDARAAGRNGPLADLIAVAASVNLPLAVAGGLNAETLPAVLQYDPAIVIVGSAVTRASDPRRVTSALRELIDAHGR